MKEKDLLNKIEDYRVKLNNLLLNNKVNDLCDYEFVRLSQLLDKLIVEYMGKRKT